MKKLGGGNSKIFLEFSPRSLGKMIPHFDDIIFFEMGGLKPPTRNGVISPL